MKPLVKRLLPPLLAAVLLVTACAPVSAYWADMYYEQSNNVIENGGFENGGYGWEIQNGALDSAAAYRGETGAIFPGGGNGWGLLRQNLRLPYDGEYEFKLHVKVLEGQTGILLIHFTTGTEKRQFTKMVYPDSGWQRIGLTVALSGPTTLEITAAGILGNLFADDAFLIPADLMPSPVRPQQNLVGNAGFEDGIAGWEPDHSPATSLAWGNASHSGSRCLEVSATDQKPKVKTRLSTVYPGEHEVTAHLYVPDSAAESATVSMSLTTAKDDAWLRIPETVLTLPAGWGGGWITARFLVTLRQAEQYQLQLNGEQISRFYVDDVSVTPTGENSDNPEPQQKNLLLNPGFEDGLSHWTQTGQSSVFTTDAQAYSGGDSALFSYFSPSYLEDCLSQTIAVSDSGSYTLSAWVLPDESLSGGGAALCLEALDGNGAVLKSDYSTTPDNLLLPWQQLSVTLNVPNGTKSLRVKLGGMNVTGAFYVDQVHLTQRDRPCKNTEKGIKMS